MGSFSERMGLKPERLAQEQGMDIALRNSLWNVLYSEVLDAAATRESINARQSVWTFILRQIWTDFFKNTIDSVTYCYEAVSAIRVKYFEIEWHEVYDLVEFVAQMLPRDMSILVDECNAVLRKERSAYRFVGKILAPVSSQLETEQVELAFQNPLTGVKAHLEQATRLLGNRSAPDFRNSIKESISAVEALCRTITGRDGASLGDALSTIRKSGVIPSSPPLLQGLEKIYGFTNGKDGIRHALMDEPQVNLEEAMFMLVTCSAFVNYLTEKAARAQIRLS